MYVFAIRGAVPKKLTFLVDMSAKAFRPPPTQGLNIHNEKKKNHLLKYYYFSSHYIFFADMSVLYFSV